MLHLDLHPELESQLATQAAQPGLSLDRYAGDLLASVLLDRALQEGLDDIEAGRTRPAREVFAELHETHGIRG